MNPTLHGPRRVIAAGLAVWLLAGAGHGCKRDRDDAARKLPDKTSGVSAAAPGKAPVLTQAAPQSPAPPARRPANNSGNAAARYGPVSTELSPPPGDLAAQLALERVAGGLERPVAVEHAPGDAGRRLFVVEQHVARIRILRPSGSGYRVVATPFLRLTGRVAQGTEQGLLGLTFHPRFAENRRLFVNYTDGDGTTRVVEYRTFADNPDAVDPASAREIFHLEQPYSNHNAGDLEFGPDGTLYVGTGDGGAAGDPLRAGQDRQTLLAKMLRFDVDADASGAVTPEMIHIGLRNPWRYAFDRATGAMYIADVGQNQWECVYVAPADNLTGHNFGWSVVECNHCFREPDCDMSGFTPAVIEYSHREGCSITGGEVYRGQAIPALDGVYFYADYCTAIIRSFRWAEDGVRQHWDWTAALNGDQRVQEISSFGQGADGELFVVSLRGDIYKLIRRPARR